MRFILPALFFCAAILSVTSCATGPVDGLIYTSTTFPGEINPHNDVLAEKSAVGCQHNFLTLFTWGDAGAGDIAHTNGIARIASIDHSHLNILYIYRDYCTIVRGQ